MNRAHFLGASLAAIVTLALQAHAASRLYAVSGATLNELNPATAAIIGSTPITAAAGSIGTIGALCYDSASSTLFLSSTTNDNLWVLNPTTGVATLIGPYNVTTAVTMHGLAVDDTGQLYGYSSSTAMGARFFRVDRLTGQATPISDPGLGSPGGIEFVASTGTMYFADGGTDSLYTIDRVTGVTTLVGAFGVTGQVGVGLAYDATLGMYASNNSTNLGLYTLNLTTGAATLVGALAGNPIALTFISDPITPSTSLCSGDGTDTPCPCTNPGLSGRGCENTFATGGASLSTGGIASISADTLVLTGSNAIPFGPGLYYEGSTTANPSAPFGVVFGNGLRCAGGATNRLEVRFADGAGASSTTVSLAAFGAAVSGSTYFYQLWYRDTGNVGTCTPGAGFNFSNARSLTWTP